MRVQSLLALVATSALLLPLGANAGKLPADYQATCVAQAQKQQGVTKDKAEAHCSCAAKVLEKNLSDEQIKDLDTLQDGVNATLMENTRKQVAAACAPKK
ncbi:hypothetical protein GPJ81_10025 [Pseudomonas alkylphenolica]|jgi:hypothetical protein|uniref:Secreted protein n=1 Tax=Pseudomonas alkylphenolica TaxID=237609 RepID=A0A6I6GVK5_9PSED|nr:MULTISPECIES: hypothetical protein [Pseudomonas]QGW76999.1 hypothetical protein GPJ81_10025 [Pseudomonas alkylphenolica]